MAVEGPRSRAPAASVRAITGLERRLMSVVALRREELGGAGRDIARVREVAAERGAELFELAGGTVLLTLSEKGGALEQATATARLALRLRAALPGVRLVLAMGRGEAAGRLPVGPVVERAAELLEAGAKAADGGVRIDEVTHALLDARFEVRAGDAGLLLVGEREIGESARTLLGRPTPYVGRDRELRLLVELARSTFEGERPAQAAVVTAPAGMGKTRLRHELLAALRAGAPDALFGVGRADAMSAGSAFVVLASALRNAAGISADEAPAAARARLLELVASVVSASERARLGAFLGELAGLPFPGDGAPEVGAARRNGALMADEITRAFVDFLRAACAARPVMLVLEDLHWGDAASVRLVDVALRDLENERFVVLALGRPEMHDFFPDLWSKRDVQSVRLGALHRRAADELVTRALGTELPAEARARIVEQGRGQRVLPGRADPRARRGPRR